MAAKLYQFLGSPFCAKVRKLLEFKGVEFETVEVDYLERKELLIASGQITPDLWQVQFDRTVSGVPVARDGYVFYVGHGNLISFGAMAVKRLKLADDVSSQTMNSLPLQ
jgi:glutaredoxin